MKKILVLLLILFSFKNYAQNSITSDDLKKFLGEWTGTLTYIDYSSNEPYTMPADLNVDQGKNNNHLSLFNIFPNEPNANSKDKVRISDNGQRLNNNEVKSVQRSSNGQIQIITEYSGKDNNKKALIRNSYLLSEDQLIIKKEVKFENSDEWLKRNEFNYKRKL